MYPHRDYFRNEPTIRSLPFAIKSTSENSWTSVVITSETDSDPSLHPPHPADAQCVRFIPTPKKKLAIIKEKLLNLLTTRLLTCSFHLSNIAHYFTIPYILIFHHDLQWTYYLAYIFGIFNDVIFFIYISIVCNKRNKCWEWLYNVFILTFPYWVMYQEITSRLETYGVIDGVDIGFFILRCFSCPLRLYWTIHPLKLIQKGRLGYFKIFLRFATLVICIIHGGAILWGLMIHVYKPSYNFQIPRNQNYIFQEDYPDALYFMTRILTENSHTGVFQTWPNLFIVCISLIAFLFILYCNAFLFLERQLKNTRLIRLQHFTNALKIHLRNQGLRNLYPKVEENHKNVEIVKKSIALEECHVIMRQVNWALVQDVLYDLNLPALKAGVILGVKHPSVECYLRHLSTKMRRDFYNADEFIFTADSQIDKMVVIVEGHVDILAEDNLTSMMSLEPGSCLGQMSLLLSMNCKASVKCINQVRVLSLNRKDFLTSTLNAFPDVYRQILKSGVGILSESKKRKKTMMMKPPQFDVNITERANKQLYKLCNISNLMRSMKGALRLQKSNVGKVDQDLTLNAIWNWMMVVISIIVAVTYPYFVAFERRFPDGFTYFAVCMEGLLVVDLILTLITYEVPKTKQRVFSWNRRACQKHLWKKLNDWSFYLDFSAAIFLETITYTLYNTSLTEDEITSLYYLLKLNRVLKIYKLFHLIWSISMPNEFYKRLLIHCLTISFVIYYTTVMLYLITCFEVNCTPNGWFRTLRNSEFQLNLKNPITDHPFLCALHASLVHIHRIDIFFTTNHLDLSISIIITLLGYIYITYVFIDLASIRYLQLQQFIFYKRDLTDMKDFCRNHQQFSPNLQNRLLNYYRLHWQHDPGYTCRHHISNFSYITTNLSHTILMAERFDTLMKVPLLATLGRKFCKYLTLKSKLYLMPPGDVVTYSGNMNKEMLILSQGYCRDENGDVIFAEKEPPNLANINNFTQTEQSTSELDEIETYLQKNITFGMASLLFNLPESHTVVTTTPCVFISIDGSALQEALRYYPKLNKLLSKFLRTSQYLDALKFDLDVPDISRARQIIDPGFDLDLETRQNQKSIKNRLSHSCLSNVKRFFAQRSFINVLKYCARSGEVYGDPFRTEEIAFLRFGMIPITIDPYGVFFLCWAALRAAVSFTLAITAPLTLIDHERHFQGHPLFYANVFCDIIIYMDLILLSYLAYAMYNGILVVHPHKTIRRFGGRSMLTDCILALPIEWLSQSSRTFALIRLFKMAQSYKYFVILMKLKRLEIRRVSRCVEFIKCLSWMVIVANAGACFLIAVECLPASEEVMTCEKGGWIRFYVLPEADATFGQVYLLVLHWTMGLLLGVCFGHLVTQGGANLYIVIGILICGVILRGYVLKTILAYFVATLQEFKKARLLEFKKMLRHLMRFLRNEKSVDRHLTAKFKENAVYYWRITEGVDRNLLLSRLHTTLLQDTLCFMYEDVLGQVPLFRNMERAFLRILVLIAKPAHYLPGQIIINQEDVFDMFYIILEGTVHIELARSSYTVNISRGSIFGHFSKETTPVMSIVATTLDYVHVLAFKSIDYFNILKNYARFDIELKNVISEYKDFMPNHTQSNNAQGMHFKEGQKAPLPVTNPIGLFQKVGFFKVWDNILTIFALCNAILVPIILLYDNLLIFSTIIIIDIVFIMAFILEFVKPYYNHLGQLVTNYQHIRKHNLQPNLKLLRLLELICIVICLTSYFMYYFPDYPRDMATPRMLFAYLRLAALYRCRYIGRQSFRDIDDWIFLRELMQILMQLIIFLHWSTCCWLLIYVGTIVPDHDLTNNQPIGYVNVLLIMVNLLIGGAMERHSFQQQWQQVWLVIALPTFTIYRYYVIAKSINCLYSEVHATLQFNFQLQQLMDYVKSIRVHSYQVKNLKKHLIDLELREMGKNFPTLLTLMPSSLLKELKILLYRPLLEKSYIFYGTEMNFLQNIAIHLRRSVYFQGDIILHNGEINKCMYFIRKGIVDIKSINEDHTEMRQDVLQSGEIFGLPQGLFRHYVPHQFTFQAQTDAEILALRLDHWEHLLRHFPKSKETIYNRIRNAQV